MLTIIVVCLVIGSAAGFAVGRVGMTKLHAKLDTLIAEVRAKA